ncbi:MAG: hypothetical protein HON76_17850 [Candidatus Scalindua sp.]|jgi:hypothetical protein|nr:hypothetical protein [Candidatus Scalindua sp.]MBT5305948.1 hypothetical protein [Candidatus Scalindua sp.]MBT6228203.1 hypothetical protein [Candidatus Scalindua sp.]MBT6564385.1 hypothetical protein [Candidatus Scalindua sp.]MBT7209864.1 hypothetical protein [Candidatus Scalindua sp.]
MAKFKYLICVVTITCVTALISSGCEVQRYTTKFQATPMDSVNEDLSINPQKLTEELDDQMRLEDEKRRNMLLDEAKAKAEKGNKPGTQKIEEVK